MESHLGISSILESIEYLLQSYNLPSPLVYRLPNDTVCLRKGGVSMNPELRLQENGPQATRCMLTPFPSFCWMSYLTNMCLSTSSSAMLENGLPGLNLSLFRRSGQKNFAR